MNPENFEKKFQESDPAHSLSPMTDAEIETVVAHATTADVSIEKSHGAKKWLLGTAAVAIAAIALNAPGANVANGPMLRLGANTNAAGKMQADSSLVAGAPASDLNRMSLMVSLNYVADVPLSDVAPSSPLTAYKLVSLDNVAAIAQKLIKKFNVEDVQTSTENGQTTWYQNSLPNDQKIVTPYLYVYDGPWASFSISTDYNSLYACVDSTTSDGKTTSDCPQKNLDLISDSEAKSKALAFLNELGLDTSSLQWTTDSNKSPSGTFISATATQDGFLTPINYWFNFGDKGELVSASGSLQKLVPVGDYNVLSPAAAVARANKQADEWRKAAQQIPVETEWTTPIPSDVEVSANSGASSQPGNSASEPSEMPLDTTSTDPVPAPTFDEMRSQDAHVTSVKLSMMVVWDIDGNALWIPAYELYGYMTDASDNFLLGTVIAVVDSQIDLRQFGYGQVMRMMAK